jgi:IS30 family transposase
MKRTQAAINNQLKMTTEPIFVIETKLRMEWSPEQISGWLKQERGGQVIRRENKRQGGVL